MGPGLDPPGRPRKGCPADCARAKAVTATRKVSAMQTPLPLTRDLVLIGGGHTHALVLRMWGMNPLPGVRVTVINPGPKAPYSGMLPGHLAGHYDRAALDIDLVRLARFAMLARGGSAR